MRYSWILFFTLLAFSLDLLALPTAKITVKVINEDGEPVEGATAGAGFTMPVKTGWGSRATGESGLTDSNGLFSAEGETEQYGLGYSAIKDGYYRSFNKYNKFNEAKGILGFRKWQPWNLTVELTLKEIKKPVPLYVVTMGSIYRPLEIPKLGKFIGFDLVARDWVAPYGTGAHEDFLFKISGEFDPSPLYVDQTLVLKFNNPHDGIQSRFIKPDVGSVLRMPFHAPEDGYDNELTLRSKGDSKQHFITYHRDDQNFFFRVRTKTDDNGNIISALYGKIHGEISFTIGTLREPDKSSIHFTFYLNPVPNDTNLEFDPKKNLFKDIESGEKIRQP